MALICWQVHFDGDDDSTFNLNEAEDFMDGLMKEHGGCTTERAGAYRIFARDEHLVYEFVRQFPRDISDVVIEKLNGYDMGETIKAKRVVFK